MQQLAAFEAVVFVWQTSHVGAPVNEWADVAADEAAAAGLEERAPTLLQATYASLELERGDGQLVSGGARATAQEAASKIVGVPRGELSLANLSAHEKALLRLDLLGILRLHTLL